MPNAVQIRTIFCMILLCYIIDVKSWFPSLERNSLYKNSEYIHGFLCCPLNFKAPIWGSYDTLTRYFLGKAKTVYTHVCTCIFSKKNSFYLKNVLVFTCFFRGQAFCISYPAIHNFKSFWFMGKVKVVASLPFNVQGQV